MTVRVPAGLAELTTAREGDDGLAWLRDLPSIVKAACHRWGCTITGEPTHGQVALIVPVQLVTGPAMIKVSFPHPGNLGEADALRAFAGQAAVTLMDADDTGLVLLLERALPLTLAEHVTQGDCPVEEAIEIAGDLARRLAVPPLPGIQPLAAIAGWVRQLEDQIAAHPNTLPQRALDRARETIASLATDTTSTMLHGDLHFGNILRSHREPWLAIDPKGWFGTAAYDAFTVIAGGRDQLSLDDDLHAAVVRRVRRFAAAAQVGLDLALACCQARAVSSYLYQLDSPRNFFDVEFLKVITLGDPRERG